ncbi:MAG: DUF3419 family protein [Nanoarchaeota archaeon]
MDKVYFSTVWEDYGSINGALKVSSSDRVLTISSSGDNVLNLLVENPKKVIAIDYNSAQLALAELKAEIIKRSSLARTIELLEGSEDPANGVLLQEMLSKKEGGKYLLAHNLLKGIDNIGLFERRFLPVLRFFVKYILKDTKIIRQTNRAAQRRLLEQHRVWLQLFVRIFSIKHLYKALLPNFVYTYINTPMRQSLFNNMHNFVKFNNFAKNGYLQKVIFSKYRIRPPFLKKENFQKVKRNIAKVHFVKDDLFLFLKGCESECVDKANYSDIFDWCSEERYAQILQETARVLKPGGVLFYRELFVSRGLPKVLTKAFVSQQDLADKLHRKDCTPFYHRFVILRKNS